MNLFVLAAGFGTRFNPVTLRMPKPTIPFLNVPMGYYNFRFLKEIDSSIHSFVVNTHYLPDQVKNLYMKSSFLSKAVQFSHEPEILGTAGGIKNAIPYFKTGEPILMMNADEIIFTPDEDFIQKAIQQHETNGNMATLVVMKHPEAGKKFGVIQCEGTQVKSISKTITDSKLEPWHYIGIIILSWDVIDLIDGRNEQNIFYDILNYHLDKVQIHPIDADWYETGNQIDFLKATQVVLNELRKPNPSDKYKNVLSFVNQIAPSELVSSNTGISLVPKNFSLNPNNLSGFNVIRKDAKIDSTKEIKNAVLFSDEVLI